MPAGRRGHGVPHERGDLVAVQQPRRRGQAADGAGERRRARGGRGRRSPPGRRCRSPGRAGGPARRSPRRRRTRRAAWRPPPSRRPAAVGPRSWPGRRRRVAAPAPPAATISRVRTWSGVVSPAKTSRTTTSADASGSLDSSARASPARMRSAGERGRSNQPRTSSGSDGVELDGQLARPGTLGVDRPRQRAARRAEVDDVQRPAGVADAVDDGRHLLHVLEHQARGVDEVEVGAGHAVDQDGDAVRVVEVPDQLDGAGGDGHRAGRPEPAGRAACGWSVRGWAASGGAVAGGHGSHATALPPGLTASNRCSILGADGFAARRRDGEMHQQLEQQAPGGTTTGAPVPARALELLGRADAELLAAQFSSEPWEQLSHAHLAALRAGAAVVAARGTPSGRRAPRTVWSMLGVVAPELRLVVDLLRGGRGAAVGGGCRTVRAGRPRAGRGGGVRGRGLRRRGTRPRARRGGCRRGPHAAHARPAGVVSADGGPGVGPDAAATP